MRDEILPKQPVSTGVVHYQIYSERYILKESLISARKQSKQQASELLRETNYTKSRKLFIFNPGIHSGK